MVDTIILRVHDLRKHADLVHYINHDFKGTSLNTIYLSDEDREEIRSSPTIDAKDYIDFFMNSKTNSTHLVRYRSQEKLNSSGHYYLNFFENDDKDYIEFNFSIPKYKYGTNILMFTEHVWNRDFKYYNNSDLDYNLKLSYDFVIRFVKYFFYKEFIEKDIVDYSDVEINRIDFCFNQVFDNKRYALQYLEYQKKLRKKNLSASSNNFREYETSFMYTTKRYSMKIYHKGTEYKKHDKKENERINKEKGYEHFKIDRLQSFADKILRYEVTFRDTMLSYLFNHKVFRKNCPIHKKQYDIYKKVESSIAKNDRIAERTGSFKMQSFKQRFIEKNPYVIIDKDELQIHKKMSKLLNRNRQFLLKTNPYIEDFNSITQSSNFEERALFSKSLFLQCAKFFKSFIMEFQIKEKPLDVTVSEMIDSYNSSHYDQLPKNEMMKIYTMLHNCSFEELYKKGFYSRPTFYRYKSRFKKIGITQNNILVIDHFNVPVDLSQYHNFIMENPHLIHK